MALEAEESSRAMRDVWVRTLAQIPTVLGQMAYLASRRNDNTGSYEHFGLAQLYSQEAADEALRGSHAEAFRRWLSFTLEEQKVDLENYLSSLEGARETVLRAWGALGSYRRLLPAEANEAERELFVSDLELILELLRNELSLCASAPDA